MELDNKEIAITVLENHKKDLLARRERLVVPLQQLDQEIEHIDATVRSLQKPKPTGFAALTVPTAPEFPIGKIRKLTQVQALLVIAKHFGGAFKAQEAKRLLIRAGVMRETKNSTNIIHAVIVRSEKFDKVRPGEYRLKSSNDQRLTSADRTTLNELFPSKPVQ